MLWRASDEVLARPVAVRVVPLSDHVTATTLAAAATRAGRIGDGRFARILDVGDDAADDLGWVVTEWVEGPSLAAAVGEGPLPADDAAYIVAQVAAAVTAAAAAGVPHGRLHPHNVMLPGAGAVKIADLGMADVLGATTGDDARGLGGLLDFAVTATWPGPPVTGLSPAPTEAGHPARHDRCGAACRGSSTRSRVRRSASGQVPL